MTTEMVPLTNVASEKIRELEAQGFEIGGVILVDGQCQKDGTHRRATVDSFGRVQWFSVDGSGRMFLPCVTPSPDMHGADGEARN